jgi:hypothetical protein
MPSKKKRVASRQAQLSQRRRRERNRERRDDSAPGPAIGPREMPADPPTDPVAQQDAIGGSDTVAPVRPSGSSTATPANRQPARARRRGAAARVDPVPTYPYLRSEIRHIGIVTSVIVALLVLLTVVLR